MSVSEKEIRMHLLKPVQEEDDSSVTTDVLALWCQHWKTKLECMSKEKRKAFLKTKELNSSWHHIIKIIEKEEAQGAKK